MTYLEFQIETSKRWIAYKKKSIKKMFLLFLFYPTILIIFISLELLNHSNFAGSQGIAIGVNIAAMTYFLLLIIHEWDDYKSEIRKLESYERLKMEKELNNFIGGFIIPN